VSSSNIEILLILSLCSSLLGNAFFILSNRIWFMLYISSKCLGRRRANKSTGHFSI
jgi:hypothetical protein